MGHVVDAHVYPGPVTSIFPDKTKVRGNRVNIVIMTSGFQIYARDSERAAVVGEMWGVSRHIIGHNWSDI